MADQIPLHAQPGASSSQLLAPLVPPDAAAQPHPSADAADLPAINDPDGEPNPPKGTSPLGDYVREIQLEYEEQQEEGKL
jgi:hypothetical protein